MTWVCVCVFFSFEIGEKEQKLKKNFFKYQKSKNVPVLKMNHERDFVNLEIKLISKTTSKAVKTAVSPYQLQ